MHLAIAQKIIHSNNSLPVLKKILFGNTGKFSFSKGLMSGSEFKIIQKNGGVIEGTVERQLVNTPHKKGVEVRLIGKNKNEIAFVRVDKRCPKASEIRKSYLYNGEHKNYLWIDMMRINKAQQGGNTRKALYSELVKESSQQGCNSRLRSYCSNEFGSVPAIGSYKLGFRPQLGGSNLTQEKLQKVKDILKRAQSGERIAGKELKALDNTHMFLPEGVTF